MTRAIAVLILVVTAAVPSAASALPGDPPIVPLTPAPAAVVPANPAGIGVTFTCPRFRPLTIAPGYTEGPGAYFASFATSPATDGAGRLSRAIGSDGATDAGDGTCTATLASRSGAESSADAPEIIGGRVYWQVIRICGDCANGVEVSPVRSFTITPRKPNAKLRAPRQVYAGYPAAYEVALDAARSGIRSVVLERRAGRRWRRIGDRGVSINTTTVIAALPRGRQTVRLRALVGGTSFVVDTRRLRVGPDTGRTTSAKDSGRLRDRRSITDNHGPAELRVASRGRKLTRISALVPATCVTPNPGGLPPSQTLRTLTAVGAGAKIAPDGTVATYLTGRPGGGSGYLIGRLRNGTFRGSVYLSAGNCAGSRAITATR